MIAIKIIFWLMVVYGIFRLYQLFQHKISLPNLALNEEEKKKKFQEPYGVLISWGIFVIGLILVTGKSNFLWTKEFVAIILVSVAILYVLSYYVEWMRRWSRKIIYSVMVVFLLIVVWLLVDKTFPEVLPYVKKMVAEQKLSQVTEKEQEQEVLLTVGEPVEAFKAEFGTIHRLYSNKPFMALAFRPDGVTLARYQMPAGYSSWFGDEPAGYVRLEGVQKNTFVKIKQIS